MVERIKGEAFGLVCPGAANGFVGGEALQGFEAAGEVVGIDEVAEMLPELIVAVWAGEPGTGVAAGSVSGVDPRVGENTGRMATPGY